jgi:hypothetical protein
LLQDPIDWWPSEGETVCYGPLYVRMAAVEQERDGYLYKFVHIYKKVVKRDFSDKLLFFP